MGQRDSSAGNEWRGVYRAGGLAIIAAGILVLATLPLIPLLIPSLAPSSVASGIQSIQSQGFLLGVTWGLLLASDLLYLIPFPILYAVLRQVNRTGALVAVVFNTVFVAVDVSVDIPLRFSLIGLSNSYMSAQSAMQASYLPVAQLAMDTSNVAALIGTFLQYSAVILASTAMLRSTTFGRRRGYVGIVSGILGLLFIPTFPLSPMIAGPFNIGGSVFLVIWSLLVGYRLYKMTS